MVGGGTERVSAGASIMVAAAGTLLARGPQFAEALVVADLDVPAADPARQPGTFPAEPHDGTAMSVHRLALPPARPAQDRGAAAGPYPPGQPGPVWPRLSPPAEV